MTFFLGFFSFPAVVFLGAVLLEFTVYGYRVLRNVVRIRRVFKVHYPQFALKREIPRLLYHSAILTWKHPGLEVPDP